MTNRVSCVFSLTFILICLLSCAGLIQNAHYPLPVSATGTVSQEEPGSSPDRLSKDSKPIIISMVPKSLDNPVFMDAKEGAEMAARELGVLLEWVAPFHTEVEGQIEVMEGLIRRRVDGIGISCNDPEKLKNVIDKAVDAGIKVATFDSDSPGSKRLFYCGTNNYRAGWECGQAMIRIVKERDLTGKKLKIAILTGGTGAHNLNERIRGFKTATKNKLNLDYIALLACDDDTLKGASLLESHLRNHPKTDAFFFTGTWPFFAPPESMPLYQRWCHEGGITVAMDTFYPVLVAAEKGMAQALVGQDFIKMGDLTVRNLVRVIKGETLNTEYFDTGLEIVDWHNFKEVLKTKKPWEMK